MRKQSVKALSISQPILEMLKRTGLTGRVLASYDHACNLVTSEGEIIALVSSAVGNGPVNIVIEGNSPLEHLKPGLLAIFSNDQMVLGDLLVVLLNGARVWSPAVNWVGLAKQQWRLRDNLAVLCSWLSQKCITNGLLGLILDGGEEPEVNPHSLLDRTFLALARQGIKSLRRALQNGDRLRIGKSAALLAGLGPGLTPAGDDYLVGLMAGLRIWPGLSPLSPEEACQIIFEAAEGRTTLLSRAFLCAAREGLLGEAWHELLTELASGEAIEIQRATQRILSSGVTSGTDALAGFLSPYLWQQRWTTD
jgi:hypothetical protein